MTANEKTSDDFNGEAYWQAMIVMGLRSGERIQAIDSLDLKIGADARPFGGKAALRIGAADYDPLQEWLTSKYEIHLPGDFPAIDYAQLQEMVKRINSKLYVFRAEIGTDGAPLADLADWFAVRGHERCARKVRYLQKRYYTDWRIKAEVNLDACAWRLGLLGFLPCDE